MKKSLVAALALAALATFGLSACGSDLSAEKATETSSTAPSAEAPAEPSATESTDDTTTEDGTDDADTTTYDDEEATDEPDPETLPGSYDHPFAPGTKLTSDDWEITVSHTNFNANGRIAAENMFNDKPGKGKVYVMTNVAVKYKGTGKGDPTYDITVNYVGADGNTYDSATVVLPKDFSNINEMHKGARANGNIAFEVPKKNLKAGKWSVDDGGESVYVKAA